MTGPTPSLHHSHTRAYSFGEFVLDLSRARLMRGNEEVKLRPKSFELLRYFLEHHGRVVTKEELIKAVWPDSFVTDDSLVQCVRDIRRALGDAQQYVKTAPKRGYIFDVPISGDSGALADPVNANETQSTRSANDEQRPVELIAPLLEAQSIRQFRLRPIGLALRVRLRPIGLALRGRSVWPWLAVALIGILAAGGLSAWYRSAETTKQPTWRAVPLTSYPGFETNPALSPNSDMVAFTWNGEAQNNFDIYVQSIGSNRPLRLTSDPAEDSSPEWSPNGRTIAFLRRTSSETVKIVLIPANGGAEHVLTEIRDFVSGGAFDSSLRKNLAWTPDGGGIAVRWREVGGSGAALVLISTLTGEKRPLTQPPPGYFDEHPSFSPAGPALVFARSPSDAGNDLYLQALSKDFTPAGPARRLTTNELARYPDWTDDGSRIVYNSSIDGSLRTISPFSSGPSELLPVANGELGGLSVGRHLVYEKRERDNDIWRAEIPSPDRPPAVPQLLISSTWSDHAPRYSPNGRKIAFISLRSGNEQVWVCDADGSNPIQLTSFVDGPVKYPNWSQNGEQLVFHARPGGQPGADLFTISATGGPPKRLTKEPSDENLASYSRDGRWIYFVSTRSGRSEIWKMPADGGDAIRLTSISGLMPFESPDGKMVYYAHIDPAKGIWSVPVNGGVSVQVTGPMAKDKAFAVSKDGIYYATATEPSGRQFVQFLSFSTGQVRPVVVTDHQIGITLSLSPDQRFLIFAQRDHPSSDLMVIKNFSIPR